ncbi:MAG: flagellar basal body P-ring formation chaperone FlgA [Gammaproteobacteria bacterium]|uniref:flagellar basal body P-ring formation chaperone FlgA n=1 Tax=Rhodoferax sp. TaxID=50421 RepID=UPI00181ACD14|nr:flagellar basal body P-ring formation chaperone FlgA [Rhodoferax sp.]MBU3899278.1 flagellar basal body P-ring formation chaperone FlgA [Gammaproteobacteria bacterium]MBA3058159.1 flagellar basal body P-ring formation protein FlgA [Rhodoferax sp.]MBU3996920.1 flagellar basal body P-ring formation chaperone FlgA [Gammaproteobacteria bacterium]MBU4081254.1 flagellar basal body P-ring formation chaperone FlgA [Gammaproteobacteria bacterium]MBU4115265.1 flagellar basal body P-ring formation chap
MFKHFLNSTRCLLQAVALAGPVFFAVGALAQSDGVRPDFIDSTQQWLDSAVAGNLPAGSSPLRMEVTVGELDSRLRLAPCTRVEPYLPVGTRLWGKTRLGLRCLQGSTKWNVFLPVTIKAYGLAWVVKDQVAAGATLTPDDLMEAEVDWAERREAIISNPDQWLGQVANRMLSSGQALRQGMIRPAQVFRAGAQVRVLAQGPGFSITSDGQALSAGVVGESARIKMSNGQVMSGEVLDSRTVRLEI